MDLHAEVHPSSPFPTSKTAALVASLLLGLFATTAWSFTANLVATPNPNDGSFELSWTTVPINTYGVQERTGGGAWTQIGFAFLGPYAISGRTPGVYEYQLDRWDQICIIRGGEDACRTTHNYSEIISVTVEVPTGGSGGGGNPGDPYTPPGAFVPPDASNFPDANVIGLNVPPGDIVGAVQGSGGVSGGQASYSIPIVVPPGRKGMQPSVSLNYSSSSGNGVVGVGWGLSAVSSISRCSATPAQDGFTAAVQYDATRDRLCLDGQRLMVEPGYTYGVSGAHYRTEIDSFAQVIQSGGLNDSSTSFTVNYKNGRKSYYGTNANTRHIAEGKSETLTWAVKETRDSSGNTISYVYWNYGNGEWPIQAIHYTGINGADGDRHVRFEYETRTDDIRTSYMAGGKTRSTKRLWKIQTEYQTQLVREYTLTYGDSASTNRSLLRSVQECAYLAAVQHCLPATTFEWQEHTPQYVTEKLEFDNNGTPLFPHETERWLHNVMPHGDVNGDGVKDWTDWYVNAEGEVTGTHANTLANCYRKKNSFTLTCLEVDFDADGLSDSFRRNNDKLEVMRANSGGWITTGINWSDNSSFAALEDTVLGFADFNGDGWVDLAMKHDSQLWIYFHTQNVGGPYATTNRQLILNYTLASGGLSHIFDVQIYGDMDGNGTPDLVASNTQSGLAPGLPKPTTIYLMESTLGGGLTVTTRAIIGQGPPSTHINANFFHDVNGDGLTDFLRIDPTSEVTAASGNVQYRLNDGTDFLTGWVDLGMYMPMREAGVYELVPGAETETYYEPAMSKVLVMDYDGDGRQEILVAGTVVASSCANIQPEGYKCDDELYGTYQSNLYANVGTPINSAIEDDSVRQYWAVQFTEDAAGNVVTSFFVTDIIGSATQTAVIDATGDGLPDVVTVFGCRFASCLWNQDSLGVGGTVSNSNYVEGAWINRNLGTEIGSGRFEGYDLMSTVQNGFGLRHEWVYRPLSSDEYNSSNSDFYQTTHIDQADDFDYFHFASSMYLVADHRASNGVGGLNSTKYRYRGAIYNNKGRGFQGFLTIIAEEDIYATGHSLAGTDKISRTDFYQKWPESSIVDQACTWPAADNKLDDNPNCGSVISKTKTNSIHQSATTGTLGGLGATVFVAIDNQTAWVYDLNSSAQLTQQTTSRTFDGYGNVTYKSQSHTDAYTTNITETTSVFAPPDTINWWVDKLTSRTVTHNPVTGRVGPPIDPGTDLVKVVTTSFTAYDSTHRLPTDVTVTGNDTTLSPTITTSYNAHGLPTDISTTGFGVTGPRTVTTTYSKNGTTVATDGYFPFTVTNTLGHEAEQHTDPKHGQPSNQWDPNDLVTVTNYDAFGRVADLTPPGSPTAYQRYFWCDGGTSCPTGATYKIVTLSAGAPETNSYFDMFGRERLSSVKNFSDTSFVNVATDYDERGNVTFESQPYDLTAFGESASIGTRYLGYDALGRLTSKEIDQADGTVFLTTYTYQGLTTSINAGGLSMSRTYNGIKQLVETVDADGGITGYAYDGAGNPIAIKDAKAYANGTTDQITASYNSLGHKEWVQDPSWGDGITLGYRTFTYNALGEVLLEVDPNGDEVSMFYDELGRLIDRSVNGALNGKWYYDNTDTYKGLGLLDFEDSQFRADGSRLQKFYYYSDASNGRKDLLQVTHRFYENSDPNVFSDYATQTFTDGYYARPKGLRYPGGSSLAYEYNTAGFLTKEKDPVSGIVYREITSRGSRGQIEAASLANHGSGYQYNYSADYFPASGQMDQILVTHNSITLHHLTYDYDTFGNLTNRTTSYGAGASETLVYDGLHRLIQSTRTIGGSQQPAVTYSYDKAGNFTSKSDKAAAYVYSPSQPNRLTRIENAAGTTLEYFYYDLNGNLTNNGAQVIVYNAFNKPVSIREWSVAPMTLFTYGADSLRYRQINLAGETIYYIDKLIEIESTSSGKDYRHYISDVVILTKSGDLNDPSPSIAYIHRDRLGSIVNITDDTGIIQEDRGFDAFGKPRNGDWSDKTPPVIGSTITDRGFTEHEHLDDHELIHMNGRGYDYGLGRFLSIDPIIQAPGNSQSLNPYSYIMNNPLSGTDPSGYCGTASRIDGGGGMSPCVVKQYGPNQADSAGGGKVKSTEARSNGASVGKKSFQAKSTGNNTDEINSQQQTTSAYGGGTNGDSADFNPYEQTGGRGIQKNKFKLNKNGDIEDSTEITGPFVEAKNKVVTDDIAKIRFKKGGVNYYHSGKDIVPLNADGTVKTDAYAISGTEGEVLAIRAARAFGKNVVIIKTPNGNHVIYGHMESVASGLKVGRKIKTGTRLGIIGNEGLKTSSHATKGLHLHVEIRQGSTPFVGLRYGIK